MSRRLFSSAVVLAIGCTTATGAFAADKAPSKADPLQADPNMVEAWKDMRFGMFLCWGPVSLTGKEIGWSRGAPAWGRRPGVRGAKGPTPADFYDALHEKWKPTHFDAERWVTVAKDAGMKYLIFLVKHHDGFCLYDTKLTDYRSTGPRSAWKTDVMKHVADACRKHRIKLIPYYSQPDWHHPDYLGEHHERYVRYLHGQVRELLTGYGRIDGLWFDNLRGVCPATAKLWEAETLFRMARSIQPHLLINNRCGLAGDFDTPENRVGFFQTKRPWETCATLTGQWAWKPNDPFFRSFDECIRMLVCVVIGDGNFALNTGPMPDGRIEPRQVERFAEIGRWMSKFGRSIHATRGGPFIAPDERTRGRGGSYAHFKLPGGRWWGGSTHRGKSVYLHVLRWPGGTIRLPDIGRKVVAHSVLAGGRATVVQTDKGIEVGVPRDLRDPLDTIIHLEFDRPVTDVEPVRTGKPSLARGGKASASGEWPDPHLPAGLAFDGDHGTRWGGAPGSRSGWLAVDLGKPAAVARAVIVEGHWNRVRKFELQYKADGEWKTIVAGTKLGAVKHLTFPPVRAQQFRLNILEATNVPTLHEIELFAE